MTTKSIAQHRADRRAKRLATCRHFTGLLNKECKVGVPYDDVKDKSGPGMVRLACLCEGVKTCAKLELRTPEEIDAEEAEWTRRLNAMGPARKAILATKLSRGTVDCTLCGKPGALHFTVSSYNGHVWGKCATDGCLAWME